MDITFDEVTAELQGERRTSARRGGAEQPSEARNSPHDRERDEHTRARQRARKQARLDTF